MRGSLLAYTIIVILFSVAVFVDLFLRYVEKIKSFGISKVFFKKKYSTVPFEDFLPHSLSSIVIDITIAGYSGLIMDCIGLEIYISLPLALITSLIVNFVRMHFILPKIDIITDITFPDGEKATGMEAICTSDIEKDGYGSVCIEYKGGKYIRDAMSANETNISKGEKVIIIHEEGKVCFVEKNDEVFDIIDKDRTTK